MGESFDFELPDHFTAGAVGQPGARVFYLQARQERTLVSLKCEKEHVHALAEYLARLLARMSAAAGDDPPDAALLEPVEPAWVIASLGVGYDQAQDRIMLEARELLEEEDPGAEPATARFRITRAQALAFVERVRELVKSGRPICPMCQQPKDAEGHVCPRSNGRVVHQ